MKVRGGVKERLKQVVQWPLDEQTGILVYSNTDGFYLDEYVALAHLQLFLIRRRRDAVLLYRYRPRFNRWTGRISWTFRGLQTVHDLLRRHRWDDSVLRFAPERDPVAAQVVRSTGRFLELFGTDRAPRHHSPPFGEVYFGYKTDTPPRWERSPALLEMTRRRLALREVGNFSDDDVAETWQRSSREIRGLVCWPQELLARAPGRRYIDRFGELAPTVFDGVVEGDSVGLWKFLDGSWVPRIQEPVRVLVKTSSLAGFPYVNPAFEVLRDRGLIDVQATRKDWLSQADDAQIDAVVQKLEQMAPDPVYAMMNELQRRSRVPVDFTESDLGNALCDPRTFLRASTVPLPLLLHVPGGFSPETSHWEMPSLTFQLGELPGRTLRALREKRHAPPLVPHGRTPACVE